MEESKKETVTDLIRNRIKKVLNHYGSNVNCISSTSAEQVRLNNQINKQTSISAETISFILSAFDEVSPEWLTTGRGDMIRKELINATPSGVPFYSQLPVSAGRYDMVGVTESPSGFIQLPGVNAIASFPVIGCSMEPLIKAGDIVAVDRVDRWDRLDPDKIYMVITKHERMIKHLRVDNEDDQYIWAISSNHKEFKVFKEEIVIIYQVVYFGRLV